MPFFRRESRSLEDEEPLLGASNRDPLSPTKHVAAPLDEDGNANDFVITATQSNDAPADGATRRPKAAFWRAIIAVWVTLFCAECSRGLILPSLFLYVHFLGGGAKELGYIIGVFSLGRLVSSFALGWWQDWRGAKGALLISLLISLIGNGLYLLSDGPLKSVWLILAARFLVGFGSGVLGVVRTVVAEETTVEQRVRFVAWTNLVQYVAFAVVPVLGGLFGEVNFSVWKVTVRSFTAPALLLCVMNLGAMLLVTFTIKGSMSSKAAESKEETIEPSLRRIYLALFIALNFVARGVVSYFETLGPEMFIGVWPDDDNHADDVEDASQMLSALGGVGLIFYFLVDPLSKLLGEARVLLISLALLGVGSVALVSYTSLGAPFTIYQFLAGGFLLWTVATPMVQTLIISSFSKIIGSKPQGKFMAYITAAGSVARILCPAMSGWLGASGSFLAGAVMSFLSVAAVLIYQRAHRIAHHLHATKTAPRNERRSRDSDAYELQLHPPSPKP